MKLIKVSTRSPKLYNPESVLKFITVAKAFAALSKNPKRKVGALIIGDGDTVIAQGWNDMPRGVLHGPDRYKQPLKDHYMAHAECNAIANAARSGVATSGATMLVTGLMPCSHCAQMIIGAGIKRIVYPEPAEVDPKWQSSFAASYAMFIEAGIEINIYQENEDVAS